MNGKHLGVIFATNYSEKENLLLPKQPSEEHFQSKLDQKNREISKLKSKVYQIEDTTQQCDNFMKKILNLLDPKTKREMTGEYEDIKKILNEGKVEEETTTERRSSTPCKSPIFGSPMSMSRTSIRSPLRSRMASMEDCDNGVFLELYDENIRLKEELNDKMDEIDYLTSQLENKSQPIIPRSLSSFASSPIFSMSSHSLSEKVGSLSISEKVSPKQHNKKHQLLEFFSDQEVATVFENEMVSRLVTCRNLALSPSGIHPDVLTLFSFLKAGCYVTGQCYNFLGRVIKSLYNMFKTSLHQEKLIFWLVQVVYLADLVAAEYNLGPGIVSLGLDFSNLSKVSTVMSPIRSETARRFLSDLREIAIKIYGKIVRATMEALRPVLQKLVHGENGSVSNSSGNDSVSSSPEGTKTVSTPRSLTGGWNVLKKSSGSAVPEEPANTIPTVVSSSNVLGTGSRPEDPTCVILATLNKHYVLFEKALLCSTLVLQYFNQIYRNMDAVMFNELFRYFPKFSGEIGVSIKLGISQLNWWKFENLRKYYTLKENSNPDFRWSPLSDIGVFEYLSQAINVLVLDKVLFEDQNFVEQHFHNLSANHLFVLLARFIPDAMSPHEVPAELLEKLKAQCGGQELVPLDEAQNYSILTKRK